MTGLGCDSGHWWSKVFPSLDGSRRICSSCGRIEEKNGGPDWELIHQPRPLRGIG
jgi:hypothetical protein